jgi:response regulator RpfG family c-di-GMP phosphodiesterase
LTSKGKVLFVDDEKRVLNSMRGLFRRDYELFLTTDGAEAVRLVAEHDIDVIVADQRMPGLSGVQVLGKVREASPRTVRILLTGYADPEAIEGSINIGEVFRFLSKPCQPKLLRETLKLGIEASRANPVPAAPTAPAPVAERSAYQPAPHEESKATTMPLVEPDTAPVEQQRPAASISDTQRVRAANDPATHWQDHTEIVMSGDSSQEVRQLQLTQEANASISKVGVAVFTVNPNFAESAMRAISIDRSAMLVTTLVKVAEVLEQREAGVLVTDFTSDISLLQNMIGTLKHHLPELVTIVVSENRDATDMINLINYGQVFRYVEKPIEAEMLRTDVNAAVLKHLQLVEHPELIQRHQVINFSTPTAGSPTFNQFIGKVTRLRGRWTNTYDKSH